MNAELQKGRILTIVILLLSSAYLMSLQTEEGTVRAETEPRGTYLELYTPFESPGWTDGTHDVEDFSQEGNHGKLMG